MDDKNFKLHNAVKNGDVELAHKLLWKGADLYDEKAFPSESPLMTAVETNNFEMMELLLIWGCNPNYHGFDHYSQSAFHKAIQKGNPKTVLLLMQYQADANSVFHYFYKTITVLHCASHLGYEEIVLMLIEAGSDIERKDEHSCTPLHTACSAGKWNIVKILISFGAKTDAVDNCGRTPLMEAVGSFKGDWKIIELLLEKGANANHCTYFGTSLIYNVIMNSSEYPDYLDIILDILFKHGFNLKVVSMPCFEFVRSVTFFAADAVFEKLIHIGCTFYINEIRSFRIPFYRGKEPDTPLWRMYGDVRTLYNNQSLRTPLFLFAMKGRYEIVRLLLAASRDYQKETWITNDEELMRVSDLEIRQLLVSKASETIPPLKHLCRFKIRDLLGFYASTKITELPLPKLLIDYLQLKSL